MIEKRIPPHSESSSVVFSSEEGINKVASFNPHIPEKLALKIAEIQENPDPNYLYLYDRALGAGEVYGCNNNGDWFGREELKKHHETFEKNAKWYRHHQNKDPEKSIGDVLASAYNEPLDAVDLILRAPIEKVAAEIKTLDSGDRLIQTSMGAKVPYDECSYCGNKAKTRAHYCSHLRFMMKKVMPNGRQVYAKNPSPNFIDISSVIIRAAPESVVLRKIASLQGLDLKSAQMKKDDVGSNIESRGVVNPHVIEATNHLSRGDALMTLHEAKGVLRPDEFQAIMRKDASYLRPDIIPCVKFKVMEKRAFQGDVLETLVQPLKNVPDEPLEKQARLYYSDFLTKEENEAYLYYRNSIGSFTGEFLR